ncbi:MAG: sulfite exporter TauE/SafE family protein [Planctomycetota bacterium]|nr:sulfite exporter TauE/SafE family protein [Planctomycetota bacterium]
MEFDPSHIMIIAAIGFAGGFLGGLFGIGGSIIVIPLLSFVNGPNQQLYQATAMLMNVAVSGSATLKHHLRGAIQKVMVMRLLPSALVGIILGVTLSNAVPPLMLQLVFAVFLSYIGVSEMIGAFIRRNRDTSPPSGTDTETRGLVSGVGGITGLASGLLGIGGGTVMIPLLKRLCRFNLKQAIPASSATMLVTATVGAVYKNLMLPELTAPNGDPLRISESLSIAAALIPTGFLGSYIGAGLMHRLPMEMIKKLFALLLIVAAVKMAGSAISESVFEGTEPEPVAPRAMSSPGQVGPFGT